MVSARSCGASSAMLPVGHGTGRRGVDERPVAGPAGGRRGYRAYSVGFEDGGFYANGWHITGEMGGIWAPPLKLADGVWFGVDDQWAGPATKFTSGRGYVRYELPTVDGLKIEPHRLRARRRPRRAVRAHARATRAPAKTVRSRSTRTRSCCRPTRGARTDAERGRRQRAGHGRVRRTARSPSATPARLPGARHDRRAVGRRQAGTGEPRPGHWGAQPTRCRATADAADRLRRRPVRPRRRRRSCATASTVPARGSKTVWIARRRPDQGTPTRARSSTARSRDPASALARKTRSRERSAATRSVNLPGDPQLAGRGRLGQAEPRRPHADARTTCRSAASTRARRSRRRSGPCRT